MPRAQTPPTPDRRRSYPVYGQMSVDKVLTPEQLDIYENMLLVLEHYGKSEPRRENVYRVYDDGRLRIHCPAYLCGRPYEISVLVDGSWHVVFRYYWLKPLDVFRPGRWIDYLAEMAVGIRARQHESASQVAQAKAKEERLAFEPIDDKRTFGERAA